MTKSKQELREKIDEALHVDWAFKDTTSKPDKIIVTGYPQGAYHTSYGLFVKNIEQLITDQVNEVLDRVQHSDHSECRGGKHIPNGYCRDYSVTKTIEQIRKEWNE